MHRYLTGVVAALVLTIGAALTPLNSAQAMSGLSAVEISTSDLQSDVLKIKSKKGNFGKGVAVGIGAAVLGGIIANQAQPYYAPPPPPVYYAPPQPVYGGGYDPRRRCARKFRSFNWNTGMYRGYDGYLHRCPYL